MNRFTPLILVVILALFMMPALSAPSYATQTAVELRCEYARNPLGIDTTSPRFSWILTSTERGAMQSAYRILAASSADALAKDAGDKWDSGKVNSDSSVNVEYQGKPLSSGEKCYWKVRVWDENDQVSLWSDVATFEMGLLKAEDWEGQWIGSSTKMSGPLLRREFDITKDIQNARVYMSGLGWSELYVNGKKVSDRVLDPGMSYFDNARYPELGSRVPYVTHDVTDYLKEGRNAIGVLLGNGWYTSDGKETKWRIAYGKNPILLLNMNIIYTDGTTASVVSNQDWKIKQGPIRANDLCFGERYDARRDKDGWDSPHYDDSTWKPATLADPPSGDLVAHNLPAVKVMETIKPVKLIPTDDGKYIYDFGQNFSGWVKLRVNGSQGDTIRILYAGSLNDDSTLNQGNMWGATQSDVYTLKGGGEEVWEPRFTLHGFRYAELSGFPGTPTMDSLEGRFAYNAVETSGSFECSNPLLNQIHKNVCSTFKSSLQGIPQDAADRNERVAWLGDTGFVCEDYLYNFDTALFWAKWMDDIRDSQKPNGDVPVVSPVSWSRDMYEPWPCWKSTYPLITWYLYHYYEDTRVVEEHYGGVAKLVAFLGTTANNHIIEDGLGDHMEPDRKTGKSNFGPIRTPSEVTSTGIYYYDTFLLAQMARALGKTDDYQRYSKLAEDIKDAFNKEFLNTDTNQYSSGSQTSNAMALHFGLVRWSTDLCANVLDDKMFEAVSKKAGLAARKRSAESIFGNLRWMND